MAIEIPVPAGSPKVDVLLFTYRNTSNTCRTSIDMMITSSRLNGIDARLVPIGGALVEHARNAGTAKRRDDADFVLYVDDGMICWPPAIKWLV